MALISRVAALLAVASSAAAAPEGLRGATRGNSSMLRGLAGGALDSLDGKFVLAQTYNLAANPHAEFDVIEIPDQNLTHSCSNYVDDGSTVFSRDGKLVLKVASACEGGGCLNSGRIMSKQAYKYGIFALRAKVPKCNGLWPALWMLPGNTNGTGVYGDWPCSGEIDILETTGGGSVGTFNLVAGYGVANMGSCGSQPQCNKCGGWAPYCTSSTLQDLVGSFYEVEQIDCNSGEHPSWDEHLFVLNWQPSKIAVYIDPEMVHDEAGHLVDIIPKEKPPQHSYPTHKEYVHDQTETWMAVGDFMQSCHPQEATAGAPFDQPMRLVLNIAVGGYGGSPCTWGNGCTDNNQGQCGRAVGSEMEVSDIKVYQWEA